METVVLVQNVEDALASVAREAEDVHGGIVHAEEEGEVFRLVVLQEMGVGWLCAAIAGGDEVEVGEGSGCGMKVAMPYVEGRVEIGIYADEATEVYEEYEMEVCHRDGVIHDVQPLERGLEIAVERGVLFLLA